jgi:hypothetical protein
MKYKDHLGNKSFGKILKLSLNFSNFSFHSKIRNLNGFFCSSLKNFTSFFMIEISDILLVAVWKNYLHFDL